MRAISIISFFTLILLMAWYVAAQSQPEGQIFAGQIADSHCAMLGSHNAMIQELKKEGNANANAVDCVRACMKKGDKYVLYDADHNVMYQLDFGSQRANQWAGEDVKVVGTLDKAANLIHIKAIYPGYWSPKS
jgi:hypothetical protein